MNDKPTPPDGYEVMLGKDVPQPTPTGMKTWDGEKLAWEDSNPVWERWKELPHSYHDFWYAVPLVEASTAQKDLIGTLTALDTQVGGDHYRSMAIQPIEFCVRNGIGFAEGLAIKYIVRHGQKNGAEDLDKAIHCLQILRELKYGKPT